MIIKKVMNQKTNEWMLSISKKDWADGEVLYNKPDESYEINVDGSWTDLSAEATDIVHKNQPGCYMVAIEMPDGRIATTSALSLKPANQLN
mgnify:FL=1